MSENRSLLSRLIDHFLAGVERVGNTLPHPRAYTVAFLVVWIVLLVVWLLLDIPTGPGAPLFLGS